MPYRGAGVYLSGFTELQRALARIDGRGNFGLDYEFRRRLQRIGQGVADAAPPFIPHATGRHGDPSLPPLEDTLKVSATQRSVQVFSTSIYGGAQNTGAGPRAGWAARGPHITRAKASKWMLKALASQRENTQREADELVDWVALEIERS